MPVALLHPGDRFCGTRHCAPCVAACTINRGCSQFDAPARCYEFCSWLGSSNCDLCRTWQVRARLQQARPQLFVILGQQQAWVRKAAQQPQLGDTRRLSLQRSCVLAVCLLGAQAQPGQVRSSPVPAFEPLLHCKLLTNRWCPITSRPGPGSPTSLTSPLQLAVQATVCVPC